MARYAVVRCAISTLLIGAGFAASVVRAADSVEEGYLSNIRQVTDNKVYVKAGEGYFSPDGSTVVYQGIPYGSFFYQIYSQALSNGYSQEIRRLSTGYGRTTCAFFSPDGKGVIFGSSHLDPNLSQTEQEARREQAEFSAAGNRRYRWDFDPHMEIFSTDLSGHSLKRLTYSPGYDAECAYSPDGKRIVFCSDRDGDPNLYVMDANGANVIRLTTAKGYDGGPFFSPCGEWILFRSDREQAGNPQIYAIRADGQQETQLTSNKKSNWAPYWHPSGEYVIWAAAEQGASSEPNYDLWLMKINWGEETIAPGKITRITDHPSADVLPVFSPNGKQLMWTSNCTGDSSSQLWIADFRLPASDE